MKNHTMFALFTIIIAIPLASAICLTSVGGNRDLVCSYQTDSNPHQFGYAKKIIDVCSPEKPIMTTVAAALAPNLTIESVHATGMFDEAVRMLWKRVLAVYGRGARYDPLGETCRSTSATDLLLDHYSRGTSVHWSALTYSLIRTLGVPGSRAEIWEFDTAYGGNAVTAYQTDAGDWWVLDATCCQALVNAADWRTSCGVCACVDGGCVATVTDEGIATREYGTPFASGAFSQVCGC